MWLIAVAGMFAAALLALVPFLAPTEQNYQLVALIHNLIYYLTFVALPVFLLVRHTPGMWRNLRPYPISLLSVFSIVMLALVGVFFATDLTALWSVLLEELGLKLTGSSLVVPVTAPGLTLCVLYVAVLPGICEEFLFRGTILPAFERYGTRHAVLVSAALFALLHGSLEGLPAHLLLGVIMGTLVVCCNSIYAGLIFHTTYNAATVILISIANRRAASSSGAASMLNSIGGMEGVLALLVEMLLMGAMMFFTLKMFRMTARLRGITFQPRRREPLRGSEWALLAAVLLCAVLLYVANRLL